MPNRLSKLSVAQIYTQDPHDDMTHAEVLHQNEQLKQWVHALASNICIQRDDIASLGRALLRARGCENDDEAMFEQGRRTSIEDHCLCGPEVQEEEGDESGARSAGGKDSQL